MSNNCYIYLLKTCYYLTKMITLNYDLLSSYYYSELASSIILISFKVIEQIHKNFPTL